MAFIQKLRLPAARTLGSTIRVLAAAYHEKVRVS